VELNEVKKIIQDAGIVGAGGAGFPSFAKLAEGANTLVINAAECEPLLYTDYMLIHERLYRVLEGAEAIMEMTGINKCLLSVKGTKGKALNWTDGQELAPGVFVKLLPNVYPMGDEINLIYEATGRLVPPGQLPMTVGVIVMNLETVYNIRAALRHQKPVIEKWLTIHGCVPNPCVLRVPVGTCVGALFDRLGIKVPEGYTVLDGGPSMGKVIDPAKTIVTKATKGLMIFPDDIPAINVRKRTPRVQLTLAASACCQCTRCTDLCPRGLIGYPLQPHKVVRASMDMVEEMPQIFTGATSCSGCGVCELVACCQEISPRRVYAQVKGILAKNKLRYSGGAAPVDPDRDYRMVPSDRFARMIGVEQFESEPVLRLDTMMKASEITLLTRQHVGAPAVPCVQVGDIVEPGMVVAQANGMISANIHASVHGRVTAVSDSAVVIAPQN
jgi:Na+-translocating ferredoxin:NAD+ oxidoreductase RnfC subunit